MKHNYPTKKVFVAVPAMDELEYLPMLISCLQKQVFQGFKVLICVNQPDDWWEDPSLKKICENNRRSIDYLKGIQGLDLQIIDKTTKGKGWKGKKNGVGWARRILMDSVLEKAQDQDLLVSMDADTSFGPEYLESILETFNSYNQGVALSVPYYHRLTGNEDKDRAILHYEIFMRYYALNLWRIENPYSFTAIGSAIALPVSSYKAIGGITPHKSGEDFYFLQKLRKYGQVLTWNPQKVYPATRYSDRVGFGTGPAMIKGSRGDWSSYPIYPFSYFDEVKATSDLFPDLYDGPIQTPMDDFLQEKFKGLDIWQPLRENSKSKEQFIKACFLKLDAFRVLQFLKWRSEKEQKNDEENLIDWFTVFYPKKSSVLQKDGSFSFTQSNIEKIDQIRNLLVNLEEVYQKKQVKQFNR